MLRDAQGSLSEVNSQARDVHLRFEDGPQRAEPDIEHGNAHEEKIPVETSVRTAAGCRKGIDA